MAASSFTVELTVKEGLGWHGAPIRALVWFAQCMLMLALRWTEWALMRRIRVVR